MAKTAGSARPAPRDGPAGADDATKLTQLEARFERTLAEFFFWRSLAEWMDRPLEEIARRPGEDMSETARLARLEAARRRDVFYAHLNAPNVEDPKNGR